MEIELKIRRLLAAVLCTLLVAGPVCARGPPARGTPDLAKLKRLALSIPTGSTVQAEMKDKTKVSGRIGQVDNDGFDLQTVENDNIVSKRIGFDQIAKLSPGDPKGRLQSIARPLLTVMSLMAAAGAVTAAIRK